MGTMTCTATYNVNSNGNSWSYGGTQQNGGIRYSTKGVGVTTTLAFTVSINPSATNTIALGPMGTGEGYLLKFTGYTTKPSFITSPVAGTLTNTFSFNDVNPSDNLGQYAFHIGVYVNGSTTLQYSPDPILVNRDATGNYCLFIKKAEPREGEPELVEIPLLIEAAQTTES